MNRAPRAVAALAAALALALTGCAQPEHRFVTSAEDDVVVKIPRSWTVLQDSTAGNAAATASSAGWVAVFDAANRPSTAHLASASVEAPVTRANSFAVPQQLYGQVNEDALRDIFYPITEAARAQAAVKGTLPGKDFKLITNEVVTGPQASGVHLVFSYDLGKGPQIFDQVALLSRDGTRIHTLLVRCSATCWLREQRTIAGTISSFTVRVP